jgi:2-polyprenyl-3-methyl-5-hydroxy-6-metoxy-1,4-benzoquinol methylase
LIVPLTPTIEQQKAAWNEWNATTRAKRLSEISIDQRDVVVGWLRGLGRTDLDLVEVGCGAGWLCPSLEEFGRVTAIDLLDDALASAQARMPKVNFIAGDFMAVEFEPGVFDVAICLEVISHVADQGAFVAKLARVLRPGGRLMLATQNKPVLERLNRVKPPIPGQLRRWLDRDELTMLLSAHFDVLEVRSITPRTNRSAWRLINNSKANAVLHFLFGDAPKHWKEDMGLGWTLMALARKPDRDA